jgi:hypothetical protein
MAGKMYLLSTGFVPVDLEKLKKVVIVQRIVSVNEAKQLLANGFVSAVGHQSTAQLMSVILNMPVSYNRIQIFLEPGDQAICFILKARPPEGRVLSREEIEQIGYYFMHVKVMSIDEIDETKKEATKKATKILQNALEYYPEKIARIMDKVDNVIQKTSDESIIKDLYYIWNELDELKINLVECAKLFKYFFGDQQ